MHILTQISPHQEGLVIKMVGVGILILTQVRREGGQNETVTLTPALHVGNVKVGLPQQVRNMNRISMKQMIEAEGRKLSEV